MFVVFYACLGLGAALLVADLAGRLVVAAPRLRLWQWVGIAAASAPGIAPLLAWQTGRLGDVIWPFPLIAFTYAGAFVVFVVGVLRLAPPAASSRLRRAAYLVILLVAALPSWVLLFLAPFVALAGAGLVQVNPSGES